MVTAQFAESVNVLSTFLAADEGEPRLDEPGVVYILAGNALLDIATALFNHLTRRILPSVLVIAGGIGHATELLYDAVSRHPSYSTIAIGPGQAEARILESILFTFFPTLADRVQSGQLQLLIDEQSTNCGQNAAYAKLLIDKLNHTPSKIILVQDPTMSLRTRLCLEKEYAKNPPRISCWPVFIPQVDPADHWIWSDSIKTVVTRHAGTFHPDRLWSPPRFLGLIQGEIPRLRDDPNGYGPLGKGFIPHVDIPEIVENAWSAVQAVNMGDR